MQVYEFTVQVASDSFDDLERWSNRLFESGCDDSSPGVYCGHPYVKFHREADTLEAAIASVVQTVRSTGVDVERVKLDCNDLSSMTATGA